MNEIDGEQVSSTDDDIDVFSIDPIAIDESQTTDIISGEALEARHRAERYQSRHRDDVYSSELPPDFVMAYPHFPVDAYGKPKDYNKKRRSSKDYGKYYYGEEPDYTQHIKTDWKGSGCFESNVQVDTDGDALDKLVSLDYCMPKVVYADGCQHHCECTCNGKHDDY